MKKNCSKEKELKALLQHASILLVKNIELPELLKRSVH
jgi:hypothetical protein